MRVFQGEGWTWYQLGPHEKTTAQGLIQPDHWPECRNWFQGVPSANINCLDINAPFKARKRSTVHIFTTRKRKFNKTGQHFIFT